MGDSIERFGDIKENYTYFIALIQSSVLPVRLPHTNSLGQTRQKLHQKVVNDCLRVRLHHCLSDLSNHGANLQPSLFTGVMLGHRHVTCGLVITDWDLVKTFRTIKFLIRDRRGLSPW